MLKSQGDLGGAKTFQTTSKVRRQRLKELFTIHYQLFTFVSCNYYSIVKIYFKFREYVSRIEKKRYSKLREK